MHCEHLNDSWDLSCLFSDDQECKNSLNQTISLYKNFSQFERISFKEAKTLKEAFELYYQIGKSLEKIYCYASLRFSENVSQQSAKELISIVTDAFSHWGDISSFFFPSLSILPEDVLKTFLSDSFLKHYKKVIMNVLRYKPYTLSPKEERILALQEPCAQISEIVFSQMTNADFDFGEIRSPEGKLIPLTQGNFGRLLEHKEENFRKKVYNQFYRVFSAHVNTLTEALNGSIKQNLFITKTRRFSSTQERCLFKNKIPLSVYGNLISNTRKSLPILHEFYQLKSQFLRKKEITHADVYVPFVDYSWNMTYKESVETIISSLKPLGKDYQETLQHGLLNGWVDRYEKKGKRSGAFSSGSYKSYPYILMNFKSDSLRNLYTLSHEAGHSMHTLYAAKENHFSCYRYSIFEAEIASTFNEQLLNHYLLANTSDKRKKQFILAKNLDDIVATFYRQTMFAEFELIIHSQMQKGISQTPESLKEIYGNLQRDYFGQHVTLFDESWIECLRIPHFYSPFYVYQYATGLAASLFLSKKLIETGEKDFYFDFLKRGGSLYPIESLKLAGIDLESPEPIVNLSKIFEKNLIQFRKLLDNPQNS